MTRVAITGIGVVAPGAIGIDSFRELLASGRSAIAEVDRFDTAGLTAHRAALVRDFKPKELIAAMKLRRMNNLSRFGVGAAALALRDRGGEKGDLGLTGVALGTSFGPVQTSVDYMREYVEKGAALAPPQLFAESVANAPGSHIAIEWGLRGFNVTVTQRESSALAAAMYASSQIVKGSVRAAMIGGVEEVTEMLYSVLDRIGALDDSMQTGMIIGEGAAMMIAEASDSAKYGFLSGFGMARDTTASVSDWGNDPEAIVTAMRAAMDDAEIDVRDIDAIYVSANGVKRAEDVEKEAIRRVFGEIETVKTKQIFGEYAAAGALQLIEALRSSHRNVVVNSISAGGGIVCAVVTR